MIDEMPIGLWRFLVFAVVWIEPEVEVTLEGMKDPTIVHTAPWKCQ